MKSLLVLFLLGSLIPVSLSANNLNETGMAQLDSVRAYETNRQYLSALGILESIVDEYPEDRSLQLIYGRLLVKNGEGDKAIIMLQPLVKSTAVDWRPWFWLGSAHLIVSDYQLAIHALDEALSREGQVASIWVQRAIVEQELGRSESAVNLLQVANAIEPQNPDIILNLAFANEMNGQTEQAIKTYKHFLNVSASLQRHGRTRSQVLQRLNVLTNNS